MTEEKEKAKAEYGAGQAAFERGRYREAVEHLERAVAFASRATPLGGEIQLWLVSAYAALGRQPEAISLCEKLVRHPDMETRKQGKRLVYILKAPKLKAKEEWVTKIPDLDNLESGDYRLGQLRYDQKPKKPRQPKPKPEPEPIDLSQVNTQDNQFVWVALIGCTLMLGGLWWLS
ncbi:MAG: tetratricopeptide repeat protein [Cyanobacteria bacterium P01_G01_bin.38]